MSHIDDLIRDLCPDGVEYKSLGEVGRLLGGLTGKTKADFVDGTARYVSYKNVYSNLEVDVTADDFVRISDSETQNALRIGDILFTGSSENREEVGLTSVVTSLPPEPLYLNSFCTCFRPNENFTLLPDFAKHLFRSGTIRHQVIKTATGVTRINISRKNLTKIQVPLPPAEVQQEVARTLDQFTQLEAELEAELEARRQQYSFYRRRLLNFSTASNIRWQPLGEIAEIRSGWGFPKSEQGRNVGEIPFYKVSDMNLQGNEVTLHSASNYIDAATAERLRIKPAPAGTIVFPKIGAALRTNKKRILSQMSAYDNNVMGLIPTPQISPYFLYHWMQEVNLAAVANDSGAVPSIRKSVMATIPFPLLPSNEQHHIVSILDNFDAVINDLGSGLPAEIEARRKQYEYYRNRLLTFPEKS